MEKARHISKVFENEEIKNMYTALGVSVGTEDDEEAFKYRKIKIS